MIRDGHSISPYYHTFGDTITDGLMEYMDSPRYSTGYTTLFNTMGYVSEAHMLKPYPIRVEATYSFLKNVVVYAQQNSSAVLSIYNNANKNIRKIKEYGINYKLDTTTNLDVKFESYRKKYRISEVTGLPIHYYDKSTRDTNTIPYYAEYKPEKKIPVPQYYVLPQAWTAVKERIDLNRIEYKTLANDTTMQVELYYISKYETSERPYEGH